MLLVDRNEWATVAGGDVCAHVTLRASRSLRSCFGKKDSVFDPFFSFNDTRIVFGHHLPQCEPIMVQSKQLVKMVKELHTRLRKILSIYITESIQQDHVQELHHLLYFICVYS